MPGTAKEVVLLGDGAKWIWDHLGRLLKEGTMILDWFHALERLWARGRALHGEVATATADWVARYAPAHSNRRTLAMNGRAR